MNLSRRKHGKILNFAEWKIGNYRLLHESGVQD